MGEQLRQAAAGVGIDNKWDSGQWLAMAMGSTTGRWAMTKASILAMFLVLSWRQTAKQQ